MKSDFKKHKEITKRLEKFQRSGDSVHLKSKLKEKSKTKGNSEDQILSNVFCEFFYVVILINYRLIMMR